MKTELTDEAAWPSAEETPFVEIGAPGGPTFSAPATPVARVATPEARIEARPDSARAFPRLVTVPTPNYLSIQYHDFFPRGAKTAAGDGVDASLVALHNPEHPISGEYRSLRDEIRKQLPDGTSRVLMFTAVAPEAGTTTVLLNLSIALAQDARVLVIDANLGRPSVATKLAVKSEPGLCEVLAQQMPLTWAIQSTPVKGLHVLAAGDASGALGSSLSQDLSQLLMQLRRWFDWVIVDAGVWGALPDRDAACAAMDAVYAVTRVADTNRPEFLSVRGWVKKLGGLLRGYVATKM
jgi:hypothetical protein